MSATSASACPSPPKVLIKDLSASVPAGSVLALMGPSGAGKTTLLNLLTLEPSGGQPYGTVTLNGHPWTLSLYTQHAATVAQTNQLWAFLTAREHIDFAAAFYQVGVAWTWSVGMGWLWVVSPPP